MRRSSNHAGTSVGVYRSKRDFSVTSEPIGRARRTRQAPIFVVQKHAARRLHWDFRLQHGDVLWSWAVPKGPSLDPSDKRLAVRTEDHPLEYAKFTGTIPQGQYGAGTVEIWDHGTWRSDRDPQEGLEKGELAFSLDGERLSGRFVLVRLKPRPKDHAENWLLIKSHDKSEHAGADATRLERESPPAPLRKSKARNRVSPSPGARKAALPSEQKPQLANLTDKPPTGNTWLNEVKFDGYRMLLFKDHDKVRLITRNGQDWTHRLPSLARDVGQLSAESVLLDGELVALDEKGVSSFALLQQAISSGVDKRLLCFVFDLLHLDGWDLRPCRLTDRKSALATLADWQGILRYSDHHIGQSDATRRKACELGLEGIICKKAHAPYHAGRGHDWLKLKCHGREEFVVLGWTPPAGSRTSLGALHVGYHDETGALHYAGAVGTGFTERELSALRQRLDRIARPTPPELLYAGDPPDRAIHWVAPELVVEVQFIGWSGAGRLRHSVYLGLREDRPANEVIRSVSDPKSERSNWRGGRAHSIVVTASPVRRTRRKVTAKQQRVMPVITSGRRRDAGKGAGDMQLTHPDRELWPGISKRDLALYWRDVADVALPEIAGRPLAFVRCPEGIDGQRFFQKHATQGFPAEIHAGTVERAPYLTIDDVSGLLACVQISAIELHAWGARLSDPLHPDRVVFDLDPGEDVPFVNVVRAARDVRDRLRHMGLTSFCRTTGGKGLHVVVPVRPSVPWDGVRDFARGFAQAMQADSPEQYVATLPKQQRRGHILVDWLRNGLGATSVASFSPRARPGATVATPLNWREVSDNLDPMKFTIATVPERLKRQRVDPWVGFAEVDQAIHIPGTKPKRRR